MSNLFLKCPYVFQWLGDLTGPNFDLTEALLAAFSQLRKVALILDPAQAAHVAVEGQLLLLTAPGVPCLTGKQAVYS